MFGVLPANYLIEVARSRGVMNQLELELDTPIYVFVNPKFLRSEINGHSIIKPKARETDYSKMGYGSLGYEDHPRFRDTRKWLELNGYIKTESWINGDSVLKPFFFNNVLLEKGDRFLSAGAMGREFKENYNDGTPDFTLKNYKGVF